MQGMTYHNDHPHVWGQPAVWDDEMPVLDCMSQWRCPHCRARLTKDKPEICLNACHLTAPQARRFQGLMAESAIKMKAKGGEGA